MLIESTNGGVDLITYSFPCQDLSVAGSFWGFNKGMKQGSNTRSSLLWEVGRILTELDKKNKLPKFLLLENVKNMISKRHKKQYQKWLSFLKKLGYSTRTFVLNAKEYGIPQNRIRVYGLSILNYEGKVNNKNEILDIDDPPIFLEKKTLKDILKLDYGNEKYRNEAIQSQPNRTKSRKMMFENNYILNHFDKFNYSRTLTTKQDRHPNAGIIDLKNTIIGDKNRVENKANYRFLTTREAYLLMGFHEKDYERAIKNNISKEKLYQQAGNSIVVNVIISLMKIIGEKFYEENNK